MLKKFEGKIGKIDYANFERRGELSDCRAACRDGYEAFYLKGNNLAKIEGFMLSERMENGKVLYDGAKILVKGWMNIVRVGGFYQLFPMSGSFGFCHGKNETSSAIHQKICNQEKLASRDAIRETYLIDEEKNTLYVAKEFIFNKEDPFSFDLFNGSKPMVIFDGKKEVGYIHNGSFYPHDSRSNTIVHPLATWWFNNN